jgi:hypothetical protein
MVSNQCQSLKHTSSALPHRHGPPIQWSIWVEWSVEVCEAMWDRKDYIGTDTEGGREEYVENDKDEGSKVMLSPEKIEGENKGVSYKTARTQGKARKTK